jgi:hypothetical protein
MKINRRSITKGISDFFNPEIRAKKRYDRSHMGIADNGGFEIASNDTLNVLIRDNEFAFVAFMSEYCGGCGLALTNLIKDNEIQSYLKEHNITPIYVDTRSCERVSRLHNIMIVPTIKMFRNSEPVEESTTVGDIHNPEILSKLKEVYGQ